MADSKNKTSATINESDKCRCPICLEKVRNPKYLPCYHTFCEPCIQTYISSTAARKENETLKSIECPVCRSSVNAPRNDISDEEWALELPQNKLVLTISVDPEQDEHKNCMFCKRLERTVPAKHWCKTCMEAICEECKSLHRAAPGLQNHKVLQLSNMNEANREIQVEEHCQLHKGKILDVFCHDHEKLCCSTCLVKQHMMCKKVETVEDIALGINRDSFQSIVSKYVGLEKSLEDMMLENLNKVHQLNTRKQEICKMTEEKVLEITSLLENAHATWLKRFEQNHADSIGNIEMASDELKRFSTTVHEARTMLQSVLKTGSSQQLFITNYKLRNQISDHIGRLNSLDIWDFPDNYKHHNSEFLEHISSAKKFEDVEVCKLQSPTKVERILRSVPEMAYNDILQRRKAMSRKDWMKIDFKEISQVKDLSETVYYGLFVCDTMIILSLTKPPSLKIYNISKSIGKCVHTELCKDRPYDLCHSGMCLNEFYVSFGKFINHYRIDVTENVNITKLETIQLKEPMMAISRGPTAVFSANNSKRMICSMGFSINHSSAYEPNGDVPFVSSSLISDRHCFIKDGIVMAVDQNNKEIFKSIRVRSPKGLSFDLQDNILVCNMTSKLQHVDKNGVVGIREIMLADTAANYNVIPHPTGEKLLILGLFQQCGVYQVT